MNKIVHISLGKANPNRMNGVNKVLHNLLSAQSQIGQSAEYWGISFSDEHNYPKRAFKTKLYKDQKNKFRLDKKLKKDLSNLDANNTIVHLHGAFLPQLYSIAKILIKNLIPFVFTPHGGYNIEALKKSNLIKNIYIKIFEKKIVENAKSIHLIGESEKIGLLEKMKPKKVDIIPNGQNKIALADRKPESSKVLKLGYLGRIDIHTKGLDILFEAISLTKEKIPLNLTIIGSGGEMDKLKKLAQKLNISNLIDYAGALFEDEKYIALQQLDAFCLTSRNEGLPGVVLEAAAVGVPSVVSVPTNMAEYVKAADCGWILNDYTASSLATLIEQVGREKEEKKLTFKGANAKNMIATVFCWLSISDQMKTIYEK